ncbi:glutaminase A [Phycisphaerales bacterium AB-hyl4]|uniref:Glutaminase n=1 Tax=Natronomicrosphaera hydrolytica TaxID=3242702 RepID=A0ABV4U1E4_9BACT
MDQQHDIHAMLREIYDQAATVQDGQLASYIPELAAVDPSHFAISICDIHGNTFNEGAHAQPFTLQSVSKVLAYACVLACQDEAVIMQRVGVEPTGEDFDSIGKLDRYRRAFNPMVNAGAIAVTDLLMSVYGRGAFDRTLNYFAAAMGCDALEIDEAVFRSEQRTGERNRAIAHLLNNYKLLDHPVEDVLDLYFRHCSIRATTQDLARLGGTLANRGRVPGAGKAVLEPDCVRKVLSVMLSCGMYNSAGQWVYEVGLPAKSGVSGCLLIVVPGRMGIAAYSPRVDERGSSPRSVLAARLLSDKLQLHIFAT